MPSAPSAPTSDPAYAQRLHALSERGGWLRRIVDPQRPYRWNLRRMHPGFVLDVGCGIGRNLAHLDGNGVGVDHNAQCVADCRAAGLSAFEPADFATSHYARPSRFDTMLLAHVVEHVDQAVADDLVSSYLPFVRASGRVIVITPQERGQASDPTHVRFIDESAVRSMAERLGLRFVSIDSFPFPTALGRWFTYNETVSVLQIPPATTTAATATVTDGH